MLNFILGRSGSGKSEHIMNSIADIVKHSSQKIFLIVPEQYTFEMEQKYLKNIGVKNLKNVTIMGFSRIAHHIFKTYGGVSGDYAQQSTKLILMNNALHEVCDQLNVYQKSMKNISFTSSMLSLVSQFKHANIDAENLHSKINHFEDGLLKEKSKDIALIYSTYDAMLSHEYKDELNDIDRAIIKIKEHNYFNDSIMFIDEFKDFTQKELEFIKIMLMQSSDVYFSLCMDNAQKNDYSLFSCVNKTYRDLINLARSFNIKVSAPTVISSSTRFSSSAISHIEQNVFSSRKNTLPTANDDVTLVVCQNEFDEVEYVVSKISELIFEHNCKYNDIVLVTRELEKYEDILENSFKKYNIPFYLDSKKTISNSPIIKLVEQALMAAQKNISTEAIISFLKCNLCGFDYSDIATLENYCFMWDIKPNEWANDFTYNTFGAMEIKEEKMASKNTATLEKINNIRNITYTALNEFSLACKNSDVTTISTAIFTLLQNLNIHENISAFLSQLMLSDNSPSEILEITNEYKAIWTFLEEIINIINDTIPNKRITAKDYYEIFCIVCNEFDMGTIPKSLDNVLVGDIKRIRTDSPKILFILGANEKVFPYVPSSVGLYTNNEIKTLTSLGINLANSLEDTIKEERFIAYKTLCLPSNKLIITAPKSDISGTSLAVSSIFEQINSMFDENIILETYSLSPDFFCRNKESAFSVLATNLKSNSNLTSTLKELLREDEGYSKKVENLYSLLNQEPFKLTDKNITKKLFGDNIFISPSKIEQYHKCKFMYYCEHGLKLKKREKVKLNSLNKGLIIHDVLSKIFSEITDYSKFDEDEIIEKIKVFVDEYIIATMGGFENKSERFIYLYNKIIYNILEIVKKLFEELSQSEFIPTDFEYKLDMKNQNYYTIQTDDGININIIGTVDRIDTFNSYVRVIDYKSGVKKFALSNIINGINLQMFVYLMCLQYDKHKYKGFDSAGVLYMPASQPKPALDRHQTEDDISKYKQKHYRMHGAVLSNEDVLKAMEKDLQGKYLPITPLAKAYDKNNKLKPDVFVNRQANEILFGASAENMLTMDQIKKLFDSITTSIKNMTHEIYSGNIEAKPLVGNDINACDYCNFKHICRFDENSPVNEYIDLKKKELFEHLDKVKKEKEKEKDASNYELHPKS